MNELSNSQPRATIVMIARERHALTEASLERLIQNTSKPYRLIYTDGQSPDWLWQRLAERAPEWDLELVRHDQPLWPQQLRNRVVDTISTDYTVFIDNDVLVDPGWLDHLVRCADETGAGIVGPLYLWGDGITKPNIHMAWGTLNQTQTEQGTVLIDRHSLVNTNPEDVADQLVRKPCDFVEYHCMLIRTSLIKDNNLLDEHMLSVHEHIDTALTAKKRGYQIYTEPAAKVTYLVHAKYVLNDLPMYRWRWTRTSMDASIRYFCNKWQVVDAPVAFDEVRKYVLEVASKSDPVHQQAFTFTDLDTPMQRHELSQTRSDFLDLAAQRGYSTNELAILASGYRLAQALTDGGYRPCGRPFINHLVGVASVLLRYGFKIDMVLAGLLHIFYSHGPLHPNGVEAAIEAVSNMLGGKDSPVESRVRTYTLRHDDFGDLLAKPTSELSVLDAEIAILAAANSIDMHLSGEVRYSDRDDTLSAEFGTLLSHVCNIMGVSGLAETFSQMSHDHGPAVPSELSTKLNQSYRLLSDKKQAVPMYNNLLAAQQKLSAK
jgi:GT2 family glycosyltransferase